MSTILVLYHSQEYGNTGAMAEAVAEGARAAGAAVTLINANERRITMDEYRMYDAVAFGTPDYFSYFAGTMKVFLDDWYIGKKSNAARLSDKPYALFLSHGGSGRAKQPFEALFKSMGTKVGATVTSPGHPTPAILEACRALGKQLAQAAR
ncbi:MAG TPA: flavodoxin domain-containing protein [Anaerolineae bacterium]|mgnify:CR=1 FL=1|nr:flavodoxin domain-containing protein [Anaerolineae bacterium]HQH39766.1 flavodoxin domain-containing protein [Anaerolineae bacterium]